MPRQTGSRMTTLPPSIPRLLLETILWQAPLDVLLFDTDLICRYAAPASGSLFDRTADQLVGQSAREIFMSQNDDLHAALESAARTAGRYEYPSYRYTHAQATEETHYCWSVRIEPVLLRDYRGQDEFHGVLVTLSDVQDLADTNDRLEAEVAELRNEIARLEQLLRARADAGREERARLHQSVRAQLTPVVGYLQVLSRRPSSLGDRSPVDVIEGHVLPGLRRLVDSVEGRADSSIR